jgi:hypothetical protein
VRTDRRRETVRRTTTRAGSSAAELGAEASTRTPESTDDDFAIVKRVIQVGTDSPQVDASDASNRRTSVRCSNTGKDRHDLQSMFEFFDKHFDTFAICLPPFLLALNMFPGRAGEPNVAVR